MAIWLYGYMAIWLYGYMAIWLYGAGQGTSDLYLGGNKMNKKQRKFAASGLFAVFTTSVVVSNVAGAMNCESELENRQLNEQQFGNEKQRKEMLSERIVNFCLVASMALFCLFVLFDCLLPKAGIFYFSDLLDRFRVWLLGEEYWRNDVFARHDVCSRMIKRGILKKNVGPNVPRIGSKDSAKPGSNGQYFEKMVIGTGATALTGVAAVGANVLLSKNKSKNEKNNKKTENTGESYVYVNGNKPAAEVGSENGAKPSEQDQENVEEDVVENEGKVTETTVADSIDDVNVDEVQEETVSNNKGESEGATESEKSTAE